MGDLTLTNIDQTLLALLFRRAAERGRTPEELAKEVLVRELLWTPAERLAHADAIRATTRLPADGEPFEDSTSLIRRLRDGG